MRMLERLKNKQKVHTLANGGKYFHFHGLHSYHIGTAFEYILSRS